MIEMTSPVLGGLRLCRFHANTCPNSINLRNAQKIGFVLFRSMTLCIMGAAHLGRDILIHPTNLELTHTSEATNHGTN
jgi:hypothetical protein